MKGDDWAVSLRQKQFIAIAIVSICLFTLFSGCNTVTNSEETTSDSSLPSSSSEISSALPSSDSSSLVPSDSSSSSSVSSSKASSSPTKSQNTSKPGTKSSEPDPPASSNDPGFTWDQGGTYSGGINVKTVSAPGTQVCEGASGSAIDYSNASLGYVMVKKGDDTKTRVQVVGPNGSTYQRYTLPSANTYYAIPLQMGSGSYQVSVLINISGTSYAAAASVQFDVSLADNYYTYPNIYANYTPDSASVRKAYGLTMNAGSDLDQIKSIYNFIISNISYDYAKASSVTSSYVPDPDATLASRSGICFDYACLMATMCRAVNIPCKVVIGKTKGASHAWNEVYITNVGWIAVGISSNGSWKRLDATFGAVNGASYTENDGNYVTMEYY